MAVVYDSEKRFTTKQKKTKNSKKRNPKFSNNMATNTTGTHTSKKLNTIIKAKSKVERKKTPTIQQTQRR